MFGRMSKWTAVWLALAGCTQPTPSTTKPGTVIAPTSDEIADFKDRLDSIERQLQSLHSAALQYASQIGSLQTRYSTGEFDPTDSRFERIDSGPFTFAVSVEDVAPFADGIRLKLHLGNPMNAPAAGVTLHMTYGPHKPAAANDLGASDEKWRNSLKSKAIPLPETLKAGSWNPITVVLPGIEPKQFGYLSVSINATTIMLKNQ